jgi:hypothetical protein
VKGIQSAFLFVTFLGVVLTVPHAHKIGIGYHLREAHMNSQVDEQERLKPLIVHVHMPKAAGTTLADILRSIYGDRLLVAHPLRGWPQQWPDEFLADVARKRNYYNAFSGHSAYGVHEVFGRPALYISSVRDPIERFESYYNFVRHWTIHHHHEAAKTMSIGEFFRYLRGQDDIELFNLQCLLLCGHKDFATAREFVLRNYYAILPVKHFNRAIGYLSRQLSWPTVTIPKLNVTEHKSRVDELTEEDLRSLSDGNAADRDLVRFCEDHMDHWFERDV